MEFREYLGAFRFERNQSRRGWWNGYRSRSLLTSVGELHWEIPRDRAGEFPTTWVEGTVDKLICEMVIKGVSTNKVGDILDKVAGEGTPHGQLFGRRFR